MLFMHIIKATIEKDLFGAGRQLHFPLSDTQVYSIPTYADPLQ